MAWKRYKHPDSGDEFTVDEVTGQSMGLTPIDVDPVDINGRPRPPKPATDKAGQPKVSAPKNDTKES